MDQYFDALQKSHTREGILGSVSETKEEFLEKGKKAQIGEIRTWKGVKFQKQPNGGWIPVPNKVEHDYSAAKEISGHPVGKDSYSTKLSQYKDGSDKEEKEIFEGNLPIDAKGLIYEPKDSTRERVEVKKTGDSFAVSFVGNNGKRRLASLMDEASTREFLKDFTLDIDKNTPPAEKKEISDDWKDIDFSQFEGNAELTKLRNEAIESSKKYLSKEELKEYVSAGFEGDEKELNRFYNLILKRKGKGTKASEELKVEEKYDFKNFSSSDGLRALKSIKGGEKLILFNKTGNSKKEYNPIEPIKFMGAGIFTIEEESGQTTLNINDYANLSIGTLSEKKGHYEEFVDADTGEVVKKWVENKPEELSAEEEIADIERQCINAKEGITGGAAGTKIINGFKVDFDLDFSDKTISIHIKDAENKPVVARDFEYDNSEYTKEEAIENALFLIKEKTFIEKEPEFDYHSYEERENEIRKEYGPIQDELRDAKSDYDNKLQERRELQMEMEQEVGALYIKGDDEAAEALAQEYGEKFNQIDDEISELINKISELKPKVREMEDKIDEIWLH